MKAQKIRNIAIIAHVDHGKTTLVDYLLKQTGAFRENQAVEKRIMDSNPLERERGITILAKNASIFYKDIKINIVDTPGHSDFGGEVERALKMVDGVLLLVDAAEGPLPQTRFTLKKALELNLKPVVVINKIDRKDARPYEVLDEVFELFLSLGANEEQLDFPYVFAVAKQGIAKLNLEDKNDNLQPLLDMIIEKISAPIINENDPFRMLISAVDYNDYLGRISIGKVVSGKIKVGEEAVLINKQKEIIKSKITKIYSFENLKRTEIAEAEAGDIIALAGFEDANIGETISHPNFPEPLPFVDIEQPTISMFFMVNDSPLAGKDGKYVTSRNLSERLSKELRTNVSLRVEMTDSPDVFKVSGRGELHLAILIENMRREGFEFQVSRPEVILKKINDVLAEPVELLVVDIPDEFVGVVMEKLGKRKAEIKNTTNINGRTRIEFVIPSRGLIGYRSEFLTDTKGEGTMHSIFYGYEPHKGEIQTRSKGALIASEDGLATAYAMFKLQERSVFFIEPGTEVYKGMIVGENSRPLDMKVNVAKTKHLTNIRASGAEEAIRLEPSRKLSLEQALEWIADDELVEVTPNHIRIRKKYLTELDKKNAKLNLNIA